MITVCIFSTWTAKMSQEKDAVESTLFGQF